MLAIQYIKIGIFLHIIFGGIMVTNSNIIPASEEQYEAEEGEDTSTYSYALKVRFWNKPHGTIYFLFFIGLVIFIVFKNTILSLGVKAGQYIYSKIMKT
jgi:hypothetical protein